MTNPLKNDKIGEIFDYQIFEEGIMSYFEQFMQANQAYVALHGQLNLPLKPKTRVAIVTCMDSRLHMRKLWDWHLGMLISCGMQVVE